MARKRFDIMFPDTPQGNRATIVLQSLPQRKKSRFLCQLILFAEECGKLDEIINEVVGAVDMTERKTSAPAKATSTKRVQKKAVTKPNATSVNKAPVQQEVRIEKPKDDLMDAMMEEDDDDSYWEDEEETVDPFEQMKRGNNLFTKGGP